MKVSRPLKYNKPVEIFSGPDLEKIHLGSMQILETIGVRFYSEKVLQLFKEKETGSILIKMS